MRIYFAPQVRHSVIHSASIQLAYATDKSKNIATRSNFRHRKFAQ